MRTLTLVLLAALMSSPVAAAPADDINAVFSSYDAHVVMHIALFDEAALERLTREVGRSKDVTLEYSCVWSGIVVFKCTGIPVGERADVITYVRRILTSAGIDRGVEFLKVHVEPAGPGKC
ncbi:MAG: hypothetical protein JNM31_01200 [Flavobacteriales bacterium]|nr:hypothetical protein [Flavobacteriales bacterium]